MLPFLQESNLKEVIELTKLLPNPSHNQIIDKINTYLSLTSEEKTKLYLKTLKLDELIESEKNFWEFLKIDLENKEFRLIHKETQQEIIICGSDGYPCESLNHVLNLIEKEKNEINLLIVQDAPILDKKGDSAESLDRKSSKTLVKFFKKKGYQDELQGDILEFYVKSFINNEFFVLDLKQRKVFQKLNNYFFIPSDLGTSIVNFILNSNSEKKSKVI